MRVCGTVGQLGHMDLCIGVNTEVHGWGPVPLTVSNALLKHFYFSLSMPVKHVLADFCNAVFCIY